MANELQELREMVQQLQAGQERLSQERASGLRQEGPSSAFQETVSNPGSVERLFYIPRERKCPVFRGRSGITIEEWSEEVQASVRARHLGPLDQAYFMFDHLEGEAKDEIRYRSRVEREDPEKILSILKELYGCSKSHVALQERFFCRKQFEGESLQEFSHALLALMDRIKLCASYIGPNADTLVRDQFVENVQDSALCRELKQLVRQRPELSMLQVRAAAIRWEQESRPDDIRRGEGRVVPSMCALQMSRGAPLVKANLESGVVSELKAMLMKQQEQIDQLTQSVASLCASPHSIASSRLAVICRRCQKSGHYARDCDNERVPARRGGTPHSSQAASNSQSAEN